jgi:dihydrodipicolinate synthase/N-acetylneuraminate lyase
MSDYSIFQGIFVPVITPFTDDNKIYEQGIINILEYLYANGISGVWLLGSYGGFPLLSEEERIQVAEIGLAKAKELGMTVIVNVGSLNTNMAVRLARQAQKIGAHGVASVVPFYYAASHYREHNFVGYFNEIIHSVKLPVFFYNNEKATGFKPGRNFFKKMLEIGIKGFKSKGDYLEMSQQISLLKKHTTNGLYLSGSTSVHLQGHLLGSNGVTSGVALAVPDLVVGLQNALENNDINEAVRLQDLVLKARNIMGRYVGRAVSCYDILQDKGIDAGTCRSPWFRMEPAQASEVIRDLKAIEEAV